MVADPWTPLRGPGGAIDRRLTRAPSRATRVSVSLTHADQEVAALVPHSGLAVQRRRAIEREYVPPGTTRTLAPASKQAAGWTAGPDLLSALPAPATQSAPRDLERLDVEQILRSSDGPLHGDEILERRDANACAREFDHVGVSAQRRVARRARRIDEQVELALTGRQRQHPRLAQGSGIRNEWQVGVDSTELRIDRYQRGAKSLEISGVRRVADVDVAREARAGLHDNRDAADHDEVDVGARQRGEERGRSKLRPVGHGSRGPRVSARAPPRT